MSQTFAPLLGKDLTVTIQPLAIDADGVFSSSGSAVTFAGRLEEFSGGRTEAETEQVQPMDCFQNNEVVIGEVTRYRLMEIMMALKSAAAGVTKGNKLLYVVQTSRYFTITITAYDHGGTPASVFAEVATCMWTAYDPNYRRGNAKASLEFQTIAKFSSLGAFEANPAVTLPS